MAGNGGGGCWEGENGCRSLRGRMGVGWVSRANLRGGEEEKRRKAWGDERGNS